MCIEARRAEGREGVSDVFCSDSSSRNLARAIIAYQQA